MNKLKAYAVIGLASAGMTAGGAVGYEFNISKAEPGLNKCIDEHVGNQTLLDRCQEATPYVGGTMRMNLLGLVGIAGMAGAIGLSLNTVRKSEAEE